LGRLSPRRLRGQAPPRGPHIVVQGLRMVVDTIQQQGARRETLLPVDNVEVLERHHPFFVQHKSPEARKNMRWNGWRTRRAGRVLPAARASATTTVRIPSAARP
jgi:hypothetical protein